MQSWKFNHVIRNVAANAIIKGLQIPYFDVYKTLRDIDYVNNIIETKTSKKYKLVLKEI